LSRLINSNSPSKIRNQNIRTIAELLRLLSQQKAIGPETKDMAATIVYALKGIDESVLTTVSAWEKRDYWTKADRFLREWAWAGMKAAELETIIVKNQWNRLPEIMAGLYPHFLEVNIKKQTRSPSQWRGAYQKLLKDHQKVRN